jgi:hypothetical protein
MVARHLPYSDFALMVARHLPYSDFALMVARHLLYYKSFEDIFIFTYYIAKFPKNVKYF